MPDDEFLRLQQREQNSGRLLVVQHRDPPHTMRQLLKALPKMAKNTQEPALKEAFLAHREETVHQVERLEQVFEHLGQRAKAVPCEAIKGLSEEAEEVIAESDLGAVGPRRS